jgi:sugar O-acyltransferase (sialic acid O-acetyltransferase NeuD family)
MAKRLVIAGAGGFGRGVHGWIATSPAYCEEHQIEDIVFIDDQQEAGSLPAPVVSSIAEYEPDADDEVLCAIGAPGIRKSVIDLLRAAGAQFHTYVDPRATLGQGVRVGAGSIICPGSVLSAEVVVDEHVHVNFNCSLGHDTRLGDFTTVSPAVNIMGEVPVGSAVFLGGSAVVLPRLSVGAASVVGAGAVVTASVPAGVTVVGNPARIVRRRNG